MCDKPLGRKTVEESAQETFNEEVRARTIAGNQTYRGGKLNGIRHAARRARRSCFARPFRVTWDRGILDHRNVEREQTSPAHTILRLKGMRRFPIFLAEEIEDSSS